GPLGSTTPERRVKEILDEMDIVYFTHHVVEGWNVAFYLGKKLAIEVNGVYWASKQKNVNKDKRKLSELHSKGYRVLTIEDDELNDIDKVKQQIQKFWVTHISNGM
uniref:Mobile intron protein n=1 Tax=Bacillus phage 0305phi8-36 TaxID=458639 RepID=UPI00022B80E1|nr:Chain A, Mobile intron protein [Bacillus phage 0305phi8-36]3R3P_B Chain B, Mobile intron protein [Bacillus phage 0305phi8-36]